MNSATANSATAASGGAASQTSEESHRGFLNKYYGISRHFYDLTRKYYLFGRDQELRHLLDEDWDSLVEVGPGTGRNLRTLNRGRPQASFGGVEASDEMLAHAKGRCEFARLVQGFAETTNFQDVLGRPVDRILYSYCLSMVQEPEKALENSVKALAPGGEVVLVDFGDFAAMPPFCAKLMQKWLVTFHVHPVDPDLLGKFGATLSYGPGRYFFRARISAS